MNFNENGYLEPGFHNKDIIEVEDKLVTNFNDSTTRKAIIEGYRAFIRKFKECGINVVEHWIDGSFVSTKENPNDIDMLFIIDKEALDNLPHDAQNIFSQELFNKNVAIEKYKCDVYLLVRVPEEDPNYLKFVNKRNYWRGQFGFDRYDIPKGIIKINI